MAIRNIVKVGDDILNKKCRPVTDFNDRLFTLLEDLGVSELMPFLRQIDPISEKFVPENALIQEFIGDED